MSDTSESKVGSVPTTPVRITTAFTGTSPGDVSTSKEERNDEESLGSASDEDDHTVKSTTTANNNNNDSNNNNADTTASKTPKRSRAPSVAGLTIPFRTVKKAMKLDPDTPIVQNEAALMTTVAAECFLKSLAKESLKNAKGRGRNTIRYEDVAEARTKKSALAFLETLMP